MILFFGDGSVVMFLHLNFGKVKVLALENRYTPSYLSYHFPLLASPIRDCEHVYFLIQYSCFMMGVKYFLALALVFKYRRSGDNPLG